MSDGAVTELLLDWGAGDGEARERLMQLVYEELHRIAGGKLRGERVGHTLQATALVNEAYMRLVDQTRVQWRNRAHFFGIASQLMRRILVDHARRRYAGKRGGGAPRLSLGDVSVPSAGGDVDLIELDDALARLAKLDPRLAKLVELRFFGGLTVEEVAEVQGMSTATVKRDWAAARAWLYRALSEGDAG